MARHCSDERHAHSKHLQRLHDSLPQQACAETLSRTLQHKPHIGRPELAYVATMGLGVAATDTLPAGRTKTLSKTLNTNSAQAAPTWRTWRPCAAARRPQTRCRRRLRSSGAWASPSAGPRRRLPARSPSVRNPPDPRGSGSYKSQSRLELYNGKGGHAKSQGC